MKLAETSENKEKSISPSGGSVPSKVRIVAADCPKASVAVNSNVLRPGDTKTVVKKFPETSRASTGDPSILTRVMRFANSAVSGPVSVTANALPVISTF